MADNVLGSISIVITGDTSQLDAAFAGATAAAQSAGARISAGVNAHLAGTQQLTVAIGLLAATIERESAAASLAAQRNLAMQQSLNAAAGAANNFGNAAQHGGFSLRYLTFGLKDIAEGRGTYALAEMVNVVTRLGPAAIAAAAGLALIGGAVYAFTELKNKIEDAKDASEEAFGAILHGAQKANDELDVSIAKLENEIAVLEHNPANRATEALAEVKVEADNATDSLLKMIDALKEVTEKHGVGTAKGFLTRQASTNPIEDLEKNSRRQIEVLEKSKQSELTNARTPDEAQKINQKWNAVINERISAFQKLSSAEVLKQTRPSGQQSIAGQILQQYFPLDTGELEKAASAFNAGLSAEQEKIFGEQVKLADEQKKQRLEDAKKGEADARSLAVARVEAQQKALQEETELTKRFSDSQIEVSHAAVLVQISGMTDRKEAAVVTAREELRVAQEKEVAITADLAANTAARIALAKARGAAESIGETGARRQAIGLSTGTAVAAIQTDAVKEESAAGASTRGAQLRVDAEAVAAARERDYEALKEIGQKLDKNNSRVALYRDLAVQLQEIREKGSGQEGELKATNEKLKAEQSYTSAVGHTYQQVIAYEDQIAAIEKSGRDAKLAALQSDLATADKVVNSPESTDAERKQQTLVAARLQVQINDQLSASANAELQAQIKKEATLRSQNDLLQAQTAIVQTLITWQQINLGTVAQQAAQVFLQLPQQIGDSLARSIFTAPKRGESKGAEIGQGLVKTTEKAGEDLAGKLISDAIQKLIAQFVVQVATTGANTAVTGANTAVTATHTGVLGAHLVTLGAHLGVMGAHLAVMTFHLAVMLGNTIATAANTVATIFEAVASFFHFDQGGPVPRDMIAQVHSGEYVLNKDQVAGRASLPPQFQTSVGIHALSNAPVPSRLSLPSISSSSNSNSSSVSVGEIHVHAAQNPRETARAIADFMKRQTGKYSPANS